MKIIYSLLILMFTIMTPTDLWALERLVSNENDRGAGSLRRAIEGACREARDDEIGFVRSRKNLYWIKLISPLLIPENCQGKITINSGDQRVVLDGTLLDKNQEASMIVNSDSHRFLSLEFVGHEKGAGLLLNSNKNHIESSFFGLLHNYDPLPNQIAIIIQGDKNIILSNTISAQRRMGLLLLGRQNKIYFNNIGWTPQCHQAVFPEEDIEDYPFFKLEHLYEEFLVPELPFGNDFGIGDIPFLPEAEDFIIPLDESCGNDSYGIMVSGQDNEIGSYLRGGNRIAHNQGGGVFFNDEASSNRLEMNEFLSNEGPAIDVSNRSIHNRRVPESLYAKAIETERRDGLYYYKISGRSLAGDEIAIYQVATNDKDSDGMQTEGFRFIDVFEIEDDDFEFELLNNTLVPGSKIVLLACQDHCSPFSRPLIFQRDQDQDGLPDHLEDKNSTQNFEARETNFANSDTDHDGLPDNCEDKNLNGRQDGNETDPRRADTDGDGISDFIELGGDCLYQADQRDTDPNNPDTDGDGLNDGEEDLNRNGILEEGERDPTDREF